MKHYVTDPSRETLFPSTEVRGRGQLQTITPEASCDPKMDGPSLTPAVLLPQTHSINVMLGLFYVRSALEEHAVLCISDSEEL